jgi:malto-oligosyltrehalose trehalohydrolase
MTRTEDGWHELVTPEAHAGSQYKFRIDDRIDVPDPASRYQPEDVNGPSQVIDPTAFDWGDEHWNGHPWEEAAIYELHVGTFTPEGTFTAAQNRLDYLIDLGITAVELMPLSDFYGRRNWGYDGVLPYAPDSSYGNPENLKRFIEAAHQKGVMVFLDVVYNHFGPEGNYLREYSPQFFTDRHRTPWGEAINYDGPCSRPVREFVIHNALYWLEEYHFDGLRLDAVDRIIDDSSPHLLTELAERVRHEFGNERFVHLVLENDDNAAHFLRRNGNGKPCWYNAQWDDDIHHAYHVLAAGETDGYYADYARQPIRVLGRCLAEGFAYQGEPSPYRDGKLRGEPSTTLPPTAFVAFLQNHDQIGNRAFGDRLLQIAPREAIRAATEILLLAPSPPLLFMGEEFGASSPFLFFCDFQAELGAAVREGRRNEFSRFARFSSPESREQIPDPNSEQTFLRSKLDWASLNQKESSEWSDLYKKLLQLRRLMVVPLVPNLLPANANFRVIGDRGLRVEWNASDGKRLVLFANLGSQIVAVEPLNDATVIYASDSLEKEEGPKLTAPQQLPPWSVAWFVIA